MSDRRVSLPGWVYPPSEGEDSRHVVDQYMSFDLNGIAENIKRWAVSNGFSTPTSLSEHELVLAKLMLVVSELGEASEAVRDGDLGHFSEEIADAIIRLLHLSAGLGIDISGAICSKMAYNLSRPYRHGRVSGV